MMPSMQFLARRANAAIKSLTLIGIGVVAGFLLNQGQAATAPPAEHKGLDVGLLGIVPEESMKQQIGLDGYKLQLRVIGILPGGQIAKHSHEKRPGLVKVTSGTWTEGRSSGEREFSAADPTAIIEDKDTVHWFWNRGDKPATAIVCDIVPAG